MIDEGDPATSAGVRELVRRASDPSTPLVLWIGAGVSRWSGYPSWRQVAELIDAEFRRECQTYPQAARTALATEEYPEFFSLAKAADPTRYAAALLRALRPRPFSAVFDRFRRVARAINPSAILTTNVDESLEQAFPEALALERSDMERAVHEVRAGRLAIAKLHGSTRRFDSLVFTTKDYNALCADDHYFRALDDIVAGASVIFIGYGLADEYLLNSLRSRNRERPILGDGPHFAILPRSGTAPAVRSLRVLRYVEGPNTDHRGAIQFLEEIVAARQGKSGLAVTAALPARVETRGTTRSVTRPEPRAAVEIGERSAHLLADLFPPGTWATADIVTAMGESGMPFTMVSGPGYTMDEMGSARPMAHHDLAVGLLCFDDIYASIYSADRLHRMIGSDGFWALVQERIVRFVFSEQQFGVVFPDLGSTDGHLEVFQVFNEDQSARTPLDVLRRQIIPVVGRESKVESQLRHAVENTLVLPSLDTPDQSNWTALALTRSLLLRPSIRRMIGMSEGAPLDRLTKWNMHAVLRVGHVAMVAAIALHVGLDSVRLHFGAEMLANPAFGALVGDDTPSDELSAAAHAASYVARGYLSADLGTWLLSDARALATILKFRETAEGRMLRGAIRTILRRDRGADVDIAVSETLRKSVPSRILEAARRRFESLSVAEAGMTRRTFAVWDSGSAADDALVRWRRRAHQVFKAWSRQHSIGPYDPCPCGSGDKTRFCCGNVESVA